jgi:DNA-binding IclR family transcriptional regulator
MLALLDRPKSGGELAERLGVTRQRVHQLVVRHLRAGTIRVADERKPGLMIARHDDPVVLLRQEAARVLSALPDPDAPAVTARRIGTVVHMSADGVAGLLEALVRQQLVARAEPDGYQLTAAGATHCQRRSDVRRATAPDTRLPFRSERIRAVLDHMASHAAVRTVSLSRELDIPFQSMNALMQYLKRRGLVSKPDQARSAPHQVTDAGRRVLQALRRQA